MKRRDFLGTMAAGGMMGAGLAGSAAASEGRNSLPAAAPLSVARVGLRAQDGAALARWYETALGLRRLYDEGGVIGLGAGQEVLVEIAGDAALRRAFPSWAGLYHTAFLLPSRADLAAWVRHAVDTGVAIEGAADHHVSEAFYLSDPEGNGIEVYADRPQDRWQWRDGTVRMGSERVDLEGLMALAPGFALPGYRAPAATMVGHVHLQVGDAQAAARWWGETFGFDTVRASRDAVFLSTGGYHHHIAVNNWQSRGAQPLQPGYTGLSHVTLRAGEGQGAALPALARDAWGIEVRLEG